MNNFLVLRHIVCDGTQGVIVPSRLFGEQDEEQAKTFIRQQQAEGATVMQSHLAVQTPGGIQCSAFTVGQWLRGIGIQTVSYEMMKCPVAGSIIAPERSLIVPGH